MRSHFRHFPRPMRRRRACVSFRKRIGLTGAPRRRWSGTCRRSVSPTADALALDPGQTPAPALRGRFEPFAVAGCVFFNLAAGKIAGAVLHVHRQRGAVADCSRDDGGTWVKSGMPSSTMDAPSRDGSSVHPDLGAIAASSSAERIENWRAFRISVPWVYCDLTRTQEAGSGRRDNHSRTPQSWQRPI